MKDHILQIATTHDSAMARSRAKRILRVRYGIELQARARPDPVWLTAHN